MKSNKSIEDSFELVTSGVFCIEDETTKFVYVSCSNNLIKGIATVVTKIKEKDHPGKVMLNPKVKICYIGDNQNFEGTKIMNQYMQDGYTVLNKRFPVLLDVRRRVLPYENRDLAVVTLRSARGNEEIIAAFHSMVDCDEWVMTHYPEGIVESITKLEDELTDKVRKHFR